ncbi:hypothetical protein E2542_SST11850 [Spatholobus suberectus]|nr:hypothetical protein E2542_SST11850 [Spatholobus suberectus]
MEDEEWEPCNDDFIYKRKRQCLLKSGRGGGDNDYSGGASNDDGNVSDDNSGGNNSDGGKDSHNDGSGNHSSGGGGGNDGGGDNGGSDTDNSGAGDDDGGNIGNDDGEDVAEELGVYIVSFDRPGYGESDPDPNQTVKSLALDIEELADKLGIGSKFYIIGSPWVGRLFGGALGTSLTGCLKTELRMNINIRARYITYIALDRSGSDSKGKNVEADLG